MEMLSQETEQAFDTSLSVASNMEKLQIENDQAYLMVCDGIKTIKKEFKKQDAIRKTLVNPLSDHVKFINEKFKPVTEELTRVEGILKSKVSAYDSVKEKKRLELERIAREKADAERQKKEMAAQVQREKEEKALREAEELKRKAQAEVDEKEKARLLKAAEKETVKADHASNKAIIHESMAEQVNDPVIKREVVAKGVSFTKTYAAVVDDKAAFIRQCVELGHYEYLDIKVSLLTSESRQTKGQRQWAGVRVVVGTSTKVRA